MSGDAGSEGQVGAPPGQPGSPSLEPAQSALLGALRDVEPRLADLYLGAMLVLRDAANPTRFAQAAHVLREILNAVLKVVSNDVSARPGDMGTKIRPSEAAWKRVLQAQGKENRASWQMDEDLEAFLDSFGEFFEWKARDRGERRDQMRRAVRRLDASRRALPPVLEEEVVGDGMKLLRFFIKVCHFNVETDEGQFQVRVAEFESFLMARLRPRTFADQEALDVVIAEAEDGVTEVSVERAVQLMKRGAANYVYFFERLSSPQWIQPLRDRGFFRDPPAPVEDVDGIRVPGWLPSEYLARMASAAPADVSDLILSICTDNERIHSDFAGAAIEMPGPVASRIAERELKWLRHRPHLHFGLPGKLAALVCHLVDAGEPDAAFALTEELLRVRQDPAAGIGVSVMWHGRGSDWSYREILDQVTSLLLATDPGRTLSILTGLLRVIAGSDDQTAWERDHFRVSRPRLETDDRADFDVDQALLTVLRDAVLRGRGDHLMAASEILDLLTPEGSRLFNRIGCFLLLPPPPVDPGVLRRPLLVKEAFFDYEPSPEYRALLSNSYRHLREEDRWLLLEWIDSGPPRRRGEDGSPAKDSERDRREASWRIKRLALLSEDLPPDWRERYEDLVSRYGERKFGTSFEVFTSIGSPSPWTLEELEELGDEELLQELVTYEGDRGWSSPSREGLARTLSALAEKDSARLSRLAPRLASLLPLYVSWALDGLENALRNHRGVEWEPLADLFETVVGNTDPESSDRDPERDYENGRWTWVQKNIASLLVLAFESGDQQAPFSLRNRLWEVLEKLTNNPEPDAEYEQEYGSGATDPATTALNTVRGRAMQAVIGYAMWVRRHVEGGEDGESSLLAHAPEVARVLEAHLDPDHDDSPAVRSVYGQYFPWIIAIDEAWASELVPMVLPKDPAEAVLRDAAWECYLVWRGPYDACLRVLRGEYEAASREGEHPPRWEWLSSRHRPRVALGSHLIGYYLRGLIDLDGPDGLLQSFFSTSLPKTRFEVLGSVGRSFSGAVPPEKPFAARLMALWEWRLGAAASADEAGREELRGFAWWVADDCLPQEWRLAQLEELAARHCALDPAQFAYAFLKTVAATWPKRTIEVLAALITAEDRRWGVLGVSEDFREALRICLASDEGEAVAQAVRLVHLLGSIGHGDLRDLLRPDQDG